MGGHQTNISVVPRISFVISVHVALISLLARGLGVSKVWKSLSLLHLNNNLIIKNYGNSYIYIRIMWQARCEPPVAAIHSS